ncbi:putative bifunctional diguanylate cyclase/phosphodiesterase [Gordonibacter urolithinfaciens]|uniref:putative bifunctional diguanylate cyclase/phosphodiesterase n=1 Tax=Gordonibacter urolithinfaciens TaxID=1335613 RepID=UPI003AAE9860
MVVAVAAVPVCVALVHRGDEIAGSEVDRYLAELAEQATYKVNQRVSFNLELLELLDHELSGAPEDRETSIATFVDNGPFDWIGMVDAEGTLALTGRAPKDLSEHGVVRNALAGEAGVSEGLVSVFSEEKGALYASPGADGVGAIVGWVPPERMQLLLGTDSADGQGFSHVVSADGDFVLKSANKNAFLHGDNALDALAVQVEFEDGSISKIQQDMAAGESGHVRFSSDGQVREMSYAPLDEGGWYLLSIVSPDSYSSSISEFTAFSVGGMAVFGILLAFAAFGGLIVWIGNRDNREIERIAYVDPVTGGHTAVRFDQLLASRIESGRPFTFASLDVKDFKLVNDFFGKEKGDATLAYIHRVVSDELEEGEHVARVSSDVFNIVLNSTDEKIVSAWLDRVAQRVNAFNRIGDTPYLLKLNCGAYFVTGSANDIVTIRDRANSARKTAAGSVAMLQSLSFYNDPDFERMLREKELENRMDDALAKGEFVVYLQPKVEIASGRVIGAEALVRWMSGDLGIIPPDDFIPFFERNGFVVKVDLCVFEQACRIIRSWMDRRVKPVPISVNLSPVHLHVPGFLDVLEEIRARYDVPSELLELELTERVAFEGIEILARVVDDIHERGFRCSMDDFGSGYSSLNVLKDVPVDVLKIDRVFFSKSDERASDVVESVIGLARKLHMGTVAEGVETIPQVEALRAMRCDAIQGYVFSPPVPVEEFEQTLMGRNAYGIDS